MRSRGSRRRSHSSRTAKPRSLLVTLLGMIVFIAFIDLALLPTGVELQSTNPGSSALIEARLKEAQRISVPSPIRWRSLRSMSPHLIRAVVLSEDSRFYAHGGIDWREVYHAISASVRSLRPPRGASTITQQLAKNLYLSESRSPWRKVREAVIAYSLERHLSKDRILEIYLNIIEWGDFTFGAEAASQRYFLKSADTLSEYESALLAAIIPNPRTVYNPRRHPERVERRARSILTQLRSANRT
jgi:monofunctional biosynthetic peptidoglycan transglycosylase